MISAKHLSRLLFAAAIFFLIWTVAQFVLAGQQTQLLCETLKLGTLQNDVFAVAKQEGFIFATSFFHKRAAHGRFVCFVEFDAQGALVKKYYSFAD